MGNLCSPTRRACPVAGTRRLLGTRASSWVAELPKCSPIQDIHAACHARTGQRCTSPARRSSRFRCCSRSARRPQRTRAAPCSSPRAGEARTKACARSSSSSGPAALRVRAPPLLRVWRQITPLSVHARRWFGSRGQPRLARPCGGCAVAATSSGPCPTCGPTPPTHRFPTTRAPAALRGTGKRCSGTSQGRSVSMRRRPGRM